MHYAPLVLTALLTACSGPSAKSTSSSETPATATPSGSDATAAPAAEEAPQQDGSQAPSVQRIVAIGDVHGDLSAARRALRLAGAINADDEWIGGDLIVVQVGDQLDRGNDEQAILDLFERLRTNAAAAGGGFHPLIGNHEVMNVALDLRYVTDGGFADFADIPYDAHDAMLQAYPSEQRGRIAAFRPGGPYARMLAHHKTVLQIDGNVFVHGGVLPEYAEYGIDRLNDEIAAWMAGNTPEPEDLTGSGSPIWSRHYSNDTELEDCALLANTLDLLGAERMIVAHTVQDHGINSACEGKVWRVDVGLAAHYGGETEVLEIRGDTVRAIRAGAEL